MVATRMDTNITKALEKGGVVDITTTGRASGSPRRIEIFFHQLDGDYFITGRPGRKRDWLANMIANPEFTLHLKHGVTADLPAIATEVTDRDERETAIFRMLTESWNSSPEQARAGLDTWVEGAPLVRFTLV
jgi:deazaflavin-dependent oxidoreductase (nitroreductase family)